MREERLSGKVLYSKQNFEGVEFIWLRTFPYTQNDWRRVLNMVGYSFFAFCGGVMRQAKPDVIWASNPHLFAGLSGLLLAKLFHKRYFFEVRDLWSQTFVDLGDFDDRSMAIRILRVLEKLLYRHARKIIVLMPKADDYIKGLGIDQEKIIHIPPSVNLDFFANSDVNLPETLQKVVMDVKSAGKLIIGYTGAHGIADVLDTVIDAAKILQEKNVNDVYLMLVGNGTEKERLVARAKELGLTNIDFFGAIPKNAIPAFLASMDAGIVCKQNSPLYNYGVNFIKTFDYMACAKPIVWAVDSVNNPVKDAECGLTIPPENAHEMVKAIMILARMGDEERKAMGAKGFNYVTKYHENKALAKKIEEVFMA
ncbi:MAG: glycosyltransferase family 4 protein [Deltaproteobacteria bacterium]|nr:glycosyltransferase family 4 protein [Deltaproteobacteria bacterium]